MFNQKVDVESIKIVRFFKLNKFSGQLNVQVFGKKRESFFNHTFKRLLASIKTIVNCGIKNRYFMFALILSKSQC